MCIRDRLNLSTRFIGPFKAIINVAMTIRQQLVPAQRVLETLDVEPAIQDLPDATPPVSYTHLRAHETVLDLVCRLLLEKKKQHCTTPHVR